MKSKTIQDRWHDFLHILKCADDFAHIDRQKEKFAELISAIRIMFDYDQKNPYHQYDLWEHCVHTVLNLPRDIADDMLYLAGLLHDIGKPDCRCKSKNNTDSWAHYYGHPIKSAEITKRTIEELREQGVQISEEEEKRLVYYVAYHDDRVSLRRKHLNRHMKLATLDEFKNLMHLQVADAKAHVLFPIVKERIRICSQWTTTYADEVLATLSAIEKKGEQL